MLKVQRKKTKEGYQSLIPESFEMQVGGELFVAFIL